MAFCGVMSFNPRTYKRCDDLLISLSGVKSLFQSTHLQEVRLKMFLKTMSYISFNPRTYKRCDRLSEKVSTRMQSFNPRTYKRCDNDVLPFSKYFNVSIHAPTRGATLLGNFQVHHYSRFNPRTYKRCDLSTNKCLIWSTMFQSTHLQEVRPSKKSCHKWGCNVSIHAPTRGATFRFKKAFRCIFVSIHAPTRGATCRNTELLR